MLDRPRPQRRRHHHRVLGFVSKGQGFAVFEIGLDVVEEGERDGVAFVEVGDVSVEASFGILVGEEADVDELPPEDCWGFWLAIGQLAG